MRFKRLSEYINELLGRGEIILSKQEALEALQINNAAMLNSIKRKVADSKLLPLFRGYYLIVPIEYSKLGFVPPELLIDDLMNYLHLPYYVGLLSAASFYGASHQAVQIFQVVTNKQLKPLKHNGFHIEFLTQKDITDIPLKKIKTDRGYLNVSSPEGTALDLLKYVHQAGNLNRVVTVLDELAESLDPMLLKSAAENYPFIYTQRLGYILDTLGYENITQDIADLIANEKPTFYSPLKPDKAKAPEQKNEKWFLIINENIESDL